jgi:hypothetical protein
MWINLVLLQCILSLEIMGHNKYDDSCSSTSVPLQPQLQQHAAVKT